MTTTHSSANFARWRLARRVLMLLAVTLTATTAWLGIQWHILGMFAPSFFTGRLIDRFGKLPPETQNLLQIIET